jgi:CheY-like chemotaxis protein
VHILLIEDNEDLRLATQGLLEGAGHSVDAAADAEEALRLLDGPSAAVEGLVTDVELPGMSGTELLRRLISRGSTLPMVAASSLRRFEALEELESSGRVSFLKKPFSAAQLERALDVAKAGKGRVVPAPEQRVPTPASQRGSVPARQSGAPAWPRPWGPFAAAALVVLALGAGLSWKLAMAPPQLPPAPSGSPLRGGGVLLEEPLGEILEAPEELRWSPVADASGYRVVLSAVDGTVLWQQETASTRTALPAALARSLERAVVYHWRVEALGTQGRTLARSGEARFLLRLGPAVPAPIPGGTE